jgi:hypothetical protein
VRVIELRNYRLVEGRTGDFIRFFEEHFLFSQRDEGMHALGQFTVVDAPDRFVWIRSFDDMAARLKGLTAFYGGAFWLARRDTANSMMLDHTDVHLLRPLAPLDALTRGLALEDRALEPAGALPPDAGLVTADFLRTSPGGLERLVELFERRVQPTLLEHGHQVLGHFVAEPAPNDYPRLPVIQDPGLLVVLTAYRDREQHAALRRDWALAGPGMPGPLAALGPGTLSTLCLQPTARSLIRCHGRPLR